MSEPTRSPEWYSNKDLLQMVQGLREEFVVLRAELRITTDTIRKYNGLREKIEATERRLAEHLLTGVGQASVARGIREWGGWVVGLIGLLAALASRYS